MTITAVLGLCSVFAFHSFKKSQLTVPGRSFIASSVYTETQRKPVKLMKEEKTLRVTFTSSGFSACKCGTEVQQVTRIKTDIIHCGVHETVKLMPVSFCPPSVEELMHGELILQENSLEAKTLSYGPEQRPMKFVLFPNPMSTEARIEIENYDNNPFQFELYDLSGKLIKREQNLANSVYIISRDGLPTGVYIYRLLNTGGVPVNTGKIVME